MGFLNKLWLARFAVLAFHSLMNGRKANDSMLSHVINVVLLEVWSFIWLVNLCIIPGLPPFLQFGCISQKRAVLIGLLHSAQ